MNLTRTDIYRWTNELIMGRDLAPNTPGQKMFALWAARQVPHLPVDIDRHPYDYCSCGFAAASLVYEHNIPEAKVRAMVALCS